MKKMVCVLHDGKTQLLRNLQSALEEVRCKLIVLRADEDYDRLDFQNTCFVLTGESPDWLESEYDLLVQYGAAEILFVVPKKNSLPDLEKIFSLRMDELSRQKKTLAQAIRVLFDFLSTATKLPPAFDFSDAETTLIGDSSQSPKIFHVPSILGEV